jgi:acetyl esterase/lipase
MTSDNKIEEQYDESVPKPTVSNISYGPHKRNVLDFWKADSDTATPLVFVIHGGGWNSGSKERLTRFIDPNKVLAAGISIVAINYRLIPMVQDIFPPVKVPLLDAARALQFVRTNAKEWGIDKNRIAAAGGSAGACSSLWLHFHSDMADDNSSDPVLKESTKLITIAVIGAQTSLDPYQMKEWTPNSKYGAHAFAKNSFDSFYNERNNLINEINEYSPYVLIERGAPPVYLCYGNPPAIGEEQADPTHTSNFGLMMQKKCIELGVDCQLYYPGADNPLYSNCSDYLINFLKNN